MENTREAEPVKWREQAIALVGNENATALRLEPRASSSTLKLNHARPYLIPPALTSAQAHNIVKAALGVRHAEGP